ncbi:DUF2218 domain-containing protein [Paracoccus methylarcula]|uniref:DUF2218 domain-containing protein n=1 Tax=Paracoccus methylarcula TaxID=72022 RepID=A0A3R7LGZ3_9RHOB|nr:DUF2218 domain-containing protein [Paracoccus methylarcula]RNF33678.1 DUF2218 domain-containing protein [Paracoccus methylarcula]
MRQTAEFPTARGPQLLATMSKHFAHKIGVDVQDDRSRFHFEMGEAEIETTAEGLRLTADAPEEGGMDLLRSVLESHLLRFAHREDPQPLNWSSPAG